MLIIIPPSESKRPPAASGRPVALDALSFPTLLTTRRRIAEALVATSAHPDAFARLGVRPTQAPEVAGNTRLFELPAMPVLDLYTGPFHQGLDASGLTNGWPLEVSGTQVDGPNAPTAGPPPYSIYRVVPLKAFGLPGMLGMEQSDQGDLPKPTRWEFADA